MFDIADHENNPYFAQYLAGPNTQPSPGLTALPLQNALLNPPTMTAPPAVNQQPIDVIADGWEPHRRNALQKIGDVFLSMLLPGFAPFKEKVNNQNMREALQGFASDPLHAVRRLAKIPGHEKDAIGLYEKYVDDTRMQGNLERQNEVLQNQRDNGAIQIVAAIMNGAHDPDTYTKLRSQAQAISQARHMSEGLFESLFPETYDEALARAGVQSAVPVAKQQSIEIQKDKAEDLSDYREKRLGQMQETIDNTQNYREKRLGQMQQSINDRRARGEGKTAIGDLQQGDGIKAPKNVFRRKEGKRNVYYLRRSDGKYYRMKNQTGIFDKDENGNFIAN